jgi:hypothetical protein
MTELRVLARDARPEISLAGAAALVRRTSLSGTTGFSGVTGLSEVSGLSGITGF